MTEVSSILNNLFLKGLTREEFIARYRELAEKSNGTETASIFLDNITDETLGFMFDSFHNSFSGDTVTDEDITHIKSLDGDNTSFSLDDLQTLYTQTLNAENSNSTDIQRNLLISIAEEKKQEIKKQIDELENKKKNSKLQQELQEKQQEADNYKEQLQTKQDDLNLLTLTIEKFDKLQNDYNNETDEDKKNKLQEELNTIKSSAEYQSYYKISKEVSRLENAITNTEKSISKLKIKITKENKKIDEEIEKLNDKYNEIDEELQKQLDDLLIYDAATNEANRQFIDSTVGYQSGQYYSNVKGSFDAASVDFFKNSDTKQLGDIKYSSEKGQKLARDVAQNSVGFKGYCAQYVSDALERTGMSNGQRGDAYQMGGILSDNKKNFQEIEDVSNIDLKSLPAGCIIVYDQGAAGYNGAYGHVEVTLGDGTACSDGRTQNIRRTQNMRVFVPVES